MNNSKMLPNTIEFRVSSMKLEDDVEAISDLMNDLERMVHTENSFVIDRNAVYGMGWYFFELSIKAELVKKLINLRGKEIAGMKGNGIEKKFTNWLVKKLKDRRSEVQLKLKSEKEFRGFWPWLLK